MHRPSFFVVTGDSETWYVSTTMARHIEACLDADPRPRWITFVDLAGARVRVRARRIDCLTQCTAEQRAAARALFRSLRREAKGDTWDETER